MTTPIRVAVIGAGLAGQAHCFGFRNAMMSVSSDISVELVAVADPNLALAEKTAARYGFAKATADVEGLLASDEIDAVSVALPNYLHAKVLPAIIASGKHVFTEKPIGRTVAESTELQGLAEASDAITGVGFSFRRLPGLAAVRNAVRDGLIGEVHTARSWYYADYAADPAGALSWRFSQEESGGGALLDIGSHAIDALQYVAGDVAEVTSANLKTVIAERPKPVAGGVGHGAATSDETGPVTNDDVALLAVKLANGAVGQVTLSRIAWGTPNSLGVEVYGTLGHAKFDSMSGGEFHIFTAEGDGTYNGSKRIITSPAHPYFNDVATMPGGGVGTSYGDAFTAEIQEFLRAIITGEPMETNFATATAMMKVVGAALESSNSGKPVVI